MKIIGTRKEFESTGIPTADNLLRGAIMNENMQKLPTGNITFIPRNHVFRFKTHDEANAFQEKCVMDGITKHLVEKD